MWPVVLVTQIRHPYLLVEEVSLLLLLLLSLLLHLLFLSFFFFLLLFTILFLLFLFLKVQSIGSIKIGPIRFPDKIIHSLKPYLKLLLLVDKIFDKKCSLRFLNLIDLKPIDSHFFEGIKIDNPRIVSFPMLVIFEFLLPNPEGVDVLERMSLLLNLSDPFLLLSLDQFPQPFLLFLVPRHKRNILKSQNKYKAAPPFITYIFNHLLISY